MPSEVKKPKQIVLSKTLRGALEKLKSNFRQPSIPEKSPGPQEKDSKKFLDKKPQKFLDNLQHDLKIKLILRPEPDEAQAALLKAMFNYLKPKAQKDAQSNLTDSNHSNSAKLSEKSVTETEVAGNTVIHHPPKLKEIPYRVSELINKFNNLSEANALAKNDLKKVKPIVVEKKSATIDLDKTDLENKVANLESLDEHVLRLFREQEERYAKKST